MAIVEQSIADANEANIQAIENEEVNPGTVSIGDESVNLTIYDSETFPQTAIDKEMQKAGTKYVRVTKVNRYWWGYKIYLSKTVMKTAATSSLGASSYLFSTLGLSKPIVLIIVGALFGAGYLISTVKYGVELRLNKTFVGNVVKYVPTGVKYQTKWGMIL